MPTTLKRKQPLPRCCLDLFEYYPHWFFAVLIPRSANEWSPKLLPSEEDCYSDLHGELVDSGRLVHSMQGGLEVSVTPLAQRYPLGIYPHPQFHPRAEGTHRSVEHSALLAVPSSTKC